MAGGGLPGALPWAQRLRFRHRGCRGGGSRRRGLDPGDGERDGRARGECEPPGDRPRVEGPLRRRDEPAPRGGARVRRPAASAVRVRAGAVQAARRGPPVPARGGVGRRSQAPPATEPYSSDVVAAQRGIVLGKKSGIDSIRIKAAELGLELDDDAERRLLAEVKELGTKKRDIVTDDEFRELA